MGISSMIFASAPRGLCSKSLARCPRRLRLSSGSARWGWTSATCSMSWAPRILLASGPGGWFWKRKLLIFGGFWCLVEIPIGVCMPPPSATFGREAASAWATDYSLWSVFGPCLVFHLQLTVVLVDEDFSELNLALMDQCWHAMLAVN